MTGMDELKLITAKYRKAEMNSFDYITKMCKAMPGLYGNSDMEMIRNADELSLRMVTVLNTGE
jgi:hypothetical protein